MILVLRNYELFENVLSSEEGKELALLSSDWVIYFINNLQFGNGLSHIVCRNHDLEGLKLLVQYKVFDIDAKNYVRILL